MFRSFGKAGLTLILATLTACAGSERVTFKSIKPNADQSAAQNIKGLLFKPEGNGPFPAVVLLHSCGGVTSHVSQDWPNFFVNEGYVALTVDTFGSRGLGRCPNRLMGPRTGRPFKERIQVLVGDAHGGLDYLAGLPYVRKDRIAVIGYSLGGITIHFGINEFKKGTSRGNRFRAAASFYGPCAVASGRFRMPTLTASPIALLEIHGELDERIVRECTELLPKDDTIKMHILPGVYHAFDDPRFTRLRNDFAGNPMLYDPSATEKAGGLVKDFLAEQLKN